MSGKYPSYDEIVEELRERSKRSWEPETHVSDRGEYLISIKVTPFVPSVPEEELARHRTEVHSHADS